MKCKWINFSCNIPLNAIAESLMTKPISDDLPYGFDISNLEDGLLSGSFYEKSVEKQSFRMPDGSEIFSEFTKITFFEFDILSKSKGKNLLCVKNPPRTLKSFFEKFSGTLSSQVFISNLKFDVLSLSKLIKSYKNVTQFKVTEISVTDLILESHSVAELKIKSSVNAVDTIEKKFPLKNYTTKSIKICFRVSDKTIIAKISNTGLIDISEGFYHAVADILQNTAV